MSVDALQNVSLQYNIDSVPVPHPAVQYIASYEGVHASSLGTRDGPHEWVGLSARPRRRLWTRALDSGFFPASGRVVFITGLPTDACGFYAWAMCLRLPFRV